MPHLRNASAPFARFLAILALALCSFAVHAEPQAGKDYALVSPPVPTETGKKIEVLEVFWYGCPHCFDLEPELAAWVKKLPKDVVFRRMPGVLPDSWLSLAKAYYAAEALDAVDKLHAGIFNAIHLGQINLNNEKILFDWVGKQGVDSKKFADAYASFAVQNKAMRAKQLSRAYGLSGVPAIVVEGKYLTSPAMAGGNSALLAVTDELIKKARQERAVKR
jgi:thiol:disulfide interchange protein DsbA